MMCSHKIFCTDFAFFVASFPFIISILAIDPMLEPSTKTKSFYMNSVSSSFCPAKFVHWCWIAYLQEYSHRCNKDDNGNNEEHGSRHQQQQNDHFTKFGNVDEYIKFMQKRKWLRKPLKKTSRKEMDNDENELSPSSSLQRLFHPQIELPSKLNEKDAPVILVRSSKADTLRDDGVDFVSCLKNVNANIVHFEASGSHGISSIVDGRI